MKLRALALLAAIAAVAPAARADTPPNFWDLGKNPDALAQHRLHQQIETDIDTVEELAGNPQIVARAHSVMAEDNARLLLESWKGPKDRWLRFDEAWLMTRRGRYADAVPILEKLTKEFDGALFAQEVWQKLAECYVRLERTADEIHAYDVVLAHASTDAERLTPTLNRGEAIMRSGDAETAVAQFRDLLALAARVGSADISLLAEWDLAVALDRSGDFRSALDEARKTVRMTRAAILIISPINSTVYFVPDYEREWYLALGHAALALDAQTPRDAADEWRASEAAMTNYVTHATIHDGGDKWLALARRRLDEIRKRRAEADKRAPPPAHEDMIF